uniref:RNA-binding S4 domain-containing protein n=1 Tax=Phaeomonas parva TaxID=124430 RepID=A0A7S1U5Z8_9STRA|mmetsp:Transcript_3271/g.9523  ORF Transcript_3271/g.9523 Transcript_3271/m.9523 type:complete len:344 (+) Transcript_3271:148-1179(+)
MRLLLLLLLAAGATGLSAGGLRVNRALPQHSRREADRLIQAGRVEVNGEVATPGTRVGPKDDVRLDGRVVKGAQQHVRRELAAAAALGGGAGGKPGKAKEGKGGKKRLKPSERVAVDGISAGGRAALLDAPLAYIKYWKPAGVTCTTDPKDKTNVISAGGFGKLPARVFPVGRLDKDSTGLLLLTSDGRVPNAMLRSSKKQPKEYLVRTKRRVDDSAINALRRGVVISTPVQRDGRGPAKVITAKTKPCTVTRSGRDAQQLRFVLTEGRNRQIRRMVAKVGNEVVELHRDRFCGVTLKGLRPGQWAECSKAERRIIEAALVDAQEAEGDGAGRGGAKRKKEKE